MVEIYTAHYSYQGPDRVDISTRRTHPQGAAFAPDWETMVGPYREGEITETEYTNRYRAHLIQSRRLYPDSWEWLLNQEMVTLVCFCAPLKFCHRRILASILNNSFANTHYVGERRCINGEWIYLY